MALAAGIGAIAAVTAFTAWVSPPNSVDAFGYHLVRVVYWAQAGSVRFFPTHYFNQLSMPPLAEYAMLHTYVLSGGDRLVNLVQWVGFAGSILAVSLIAQALGAGRRGQMLAAVFCATLPNAILQASGAKNDCVLSLWLAAMVYFTLRQAGFLVGHRPRPGPAHKRDGVGFRAATAGGFAVRGGRTGRRGCDGAC